MSQGLAQERGISERDSEIALQCLDALTVLQGERRSVGHDRLVEGQTVVGFAAETGDASATWLEHGRAKLAKYGVDLLVVNEVGVDLTFGADHSAAVVIGADGSEETVSDGPKERLADVIWDRVLKVRTPTH